MTNKTIAALAAATLPLVGTEELPVFQGAVSKKITADAFTAGRDVYANSWRLRWGSGTTTTGWFLCDKDWVGSGVSEAPAIASTTDFTIYTNSGTAKRGLFNSLGFTTVGAVYTNGTDGLPTVSGTGFVGSLRLRTLGNSPVLDFGNLNSSGDSWLQACDATAASVHYKIHLNYNGGDVTVGANLVPRVSGKGIDFSAVTPAAGMTSKVLTNYEEGTWTPTGNGITFTAATGTYVRVGRMVTVIFNVTWPSTVNTSNAQITGLPFTPTSLTGGVALFGNLTITQAAVYPGLSLIYFTNTAGSAYSTNANLTTQAYTGTATYFV
jgi:hypothetical protein